MNCIFEGGGFLRWRATDFLRHQGGMGGGGFQRAVPRSAPWCAMVRHGARHSERQSAAQCAAPWHGLGGGGAGFQDPVPRRAAARRGLRGTRMFHLDTTDVWSLNCQYNTFYIYI